jgi:hypothetical protein
MALNYGNQSKSYLEQLLKQSLNSVKSIGYEQITIGASISKLNPPAGTTYALLVLESSVVGIAARILQNTSIPVASGVGIPLSDKAVLEIFDFSNVDGFQIIQETAGTTKLNIEYFK